MTKREYAKKISKIINNIFMIVLSSAIISFFYHLYIEKEKTALFSAIFGLFVSLFACITKYDYRKFDKSKYIKIRKDGKEIKLVNCTGENLYYKRNDGAEIFVYPSNFKMKGNVYLISSQYKIDIINLLPPEEENIFYLFRDLRRVNKKEKEIILQIMNNRNDILLEKGYENLVLFDDLKGAWLSQMTFRHKENEFDFVIDDIVTEGDGEYEK